MWQHNANEILYDRQRAFDLSCVKDSHLKQYVFVVIAKTMDNFQPENITSSHEILYFDITINKCIRPMKAKVKK